MSFTAIPPFASLTVTVYVPADNPVIVESVRLFDHKNEYGFTPPVTDTPTPPLIPPLHVTLESNRILARMEPGSNTVTCLLEVQLLPSVIVTVYTPENKLLIVAVLAVVFHK